MNMYESDTVMMHCMRAPARAIVKASQFRVGSRWSRRSANPGVALALALGLFVAANTGHAANLVWTNTSSSGIWQTTSSWTTNNGSTGNLPGPGDVATFTNGSTYYVTLTADAAVKNLIFSNKANAATVTLDLGGNSLSLFETNTTAPTVAMEVADPSSSTTVVYIASSTVAGKGLYATNSTGTGRILVGRNGIGTLFVTNGFVSAIDTKTGNGSSSRGTIVISGLNTYWTNSGTFIVGNQVASKLNSLVISNAASLSVAGAFTVGGAAGSSNSLLLDTGARLFTQAAGNSIGFATGAVNTATVQGGASWDLGNQGLSIGGTATNNSLTIGSTSSVVNVSWLTNAAYSTVSLTGGLLQVTSVLSNSGTLQGFGTVVGNAVTLSGGRLLPGFGTIIGMIVFSNNLTLASGSSTIIKLDKNQFSNNQFSNDFVNVFGTASYSGTLTVTNVGAALTSGDIFQIFAFTNAPGSFTATNLPPLDPTLRWDTSQLVSTGILAVVIQQVVPGMPSLANQAVTVGDTVIISTTVTGVPTPVLQWQLGGTNLVDGATGNGSTISGSTSNTLTLTNAQTTDSGTYSLIASNSDGVATSSMMLTVSIVPVPPSITGPTDQTVIAGNNGMFTASVTGWPQPDIQWRENGTNIVGATGSSLILTNVQYTQNGFVYSLVASSSAGVVTSTNATLTVIVTPIVSVQPQSLVVTNTQSASFSVTSANGVPAPTYQWYKGGSPISSGANSTATNATFTIASTQPSDTATYSVIVSNAAGTATSSNATLTVNSTMSAALTPTNGATRVCYDTPLYMAFDRTPVSSGSGKIKIFISTNSVTPVDTIDTSLGNLQSRLIGTENFHTYPVIITSNTVAIYPHLGVLTSNQTYYVIVDAGIFTDTNSAPFAGIADTNAWRFATKLAGPADPNNIVVAADGSGDFCTVQGAVDFVPLLNAVKRLISIRNGTYTELVDTKSKSNMTFRGQSRAGTIVQYLNNSTNNLGTHFRMAFKVYGNDTAIENMTIVNTTPQGGSQAEALMIESNVKRFIMNNAEVDSRQDTVLANGGQQSQCYFKNCRVQGNYDYIWGSGNCFFTNCELRTIPTASTYNLTAARTDFGPVGDSGFWPGASNFPGTFASNGFSFVNCQLTRADNSITNITLADSNGSTNGVVAYIDCNIDTNCYRTPSGAVLATQLLWEYGNSNLDNTASATFGLTVLTNGDARLVAALDPTIWLNGWVPQLAPNILTNPVSVTVTSGVTATFTVAATGVPDPSYQWLKGGTNVAGATSATLAITNAQDGDAGAYSVVVSNSAGSATSDSATLTITDVPPAADFSGTPTTGPTPLVVTFTDISSGTITNRFWDFGDLTTTNTTATTLTHRYNIGGTNPVSLTVSGPLGSSNQTRMAYIVAIDTLVADFSATPTTGVAPLPVHFTDNSAGTITNRFWDFGDRSTTNTTFPSVDHTYSAAGTNPVSLTIYGPGGSSATNQPNYIIVTAAPDTTPPSLQILAPTNYQAFTNANITVSGIASNASGVTVNGAAALLVDGTNWSQPITLLLGTNTITVIATDASANLTATLVVHAVLGPASTRTNHPPQITVGLWVTNALLQVGNIAVVVADETNTFTVSATDADAYQWVFGDGVNTNTTIGFVDHLFTNGCVAYPASVTVSDGQASTNSDLTAIGACQMQIAKLRVNPRFGKVDNADLCNLTTSVDLPDQFTPAGKSAAVNIGGAQVSFTLNAKGRGVNRQGWIKLNLTKKPNHWTVTARLHSGSWRSSWAKDGLIEDNIRTPAAISVTLTVVVLVDESGFAADKTLHYTARVGKSGLAK
jgi:PKD repeat protein/pectin methylesterase-like acyl-CoA thioesterase